MPPLPSFAVTVTEFAPAAVGVPVTWPDALIVSPAGKPVALNVSGSPLPSVATICSAVIAMPTVPLCAPGFVTTGATFAAAIGQLNVALPVPPRPSFAVTVTEFAPAAVGVPVTWPDALIVSPAGKPVAL